MNTTAMTKEVRKGVHVHTKVTTKNKTIIEKISKKTGLNENVIFNTALAEGLARFKTTKK